MAPRLTLMAVMCAVMMATASPQALPSQQRWGAGGAGTASSWGGRRSRAQGGGRGRGGNRGDRANLAELTGSQPDAYSGISPQPIPLGGGAAGSLSQGMRRRGNARGAAQSLAAAVRGGQADAAATAIAAAATGARGAETAAVAEAVAETAISRPEAAPQLLARSAGIAVARGQAEAYAATVAEALVYARRRQRLPAFTSAVSDAIAAGGAPTRYAYGQAIATAIAGGGEGQAAVAEATAAAFCEGGGTAAAWASAYAVALSQDAAGCLVLSQARALALARCGAGAAEAFSQAEAMSVVLGFCGLLEALPPGSLDVGWAGGAAGGSATGGDRSAWRVGAGR